MWTLLWRPVAGLAGLGVAGGSSYLLTRIEPNSRAADMLIMGGWIMMALLAIVCVALLITGFATVVLHVQDRGHGVPPSAIE